MTSRSINRQEFLVLTITVGAAAVLGCSDDPAPATPGTSGSGGTPPGTGGGGSGGVATGGGGSGGAATGGGGASTGGGGSGGAATGGGGASTGGGGSGGAATGGGGAGGSGGGASGSGGGGAGGMCGTADIIHTSDMGHTHIEMKAMVVMNLKTHINGAMATMAFMLPIAGQNGGHPHTLTFMANEIAMLKGGGTITGKMSSTDAGHAHTYTISCVA